MGLSHERTRIFTDFCLSHRHPHTDTGHSKVQRGTAYTQESRRTCQHDGLESGLSKTRLLLSRDQGNEGEVSAQHSKVTPTAANAWKMRQMAHLNAVGSTSCLILSPEGRAPRCCQCNSDRDCNDTCDASKSTTTATQERKDLCSARHGCGRADAIICGRRPRSIGTGGHWREQGGGTSITKLRTEPSSTASQESDIISINRRARQVGEGRVSECENLVLLERRPLWMLHVWEELAEIFRLPHSNRANSD